MNKKGDFGWEEIAKILLVLIALVILILLSTTLKDKLFDLLGKLADILRFR